MSWLKEVCEDTICGGGLGIVKGVFGVSLFTSSETEEIMALKDLALSTMEKATEFTTGSKASSTY